MEEIRLYAVNSPEKLTSCASHPPQTARKHQKSLNRHQKKSLSQGGLRDVTCKHEGQSNKAVTLPCLVSLT